MIYNVTISSGCTSYYQKTQLTHYEKIIYSLLAAATLMSCATSDASNNKVDKDVTITKNLTVKSSFNTIRSCSNIDIEYTPSSSVSIAATSTSYGLEALNVYVKNNTLYFETQNDKSTWSKKGYVIKVKLSAPTVSTYNTSGNSQIKVKGYVAVQGDLTVTTSGNSEVEFKQKLTARLSVAHQPATAQLSLTVRLYAHSSTQHHLATQEFRLKNFFATKLKFAPAETAAPI